MLKKYRVQLDICTLCNLDCPSCGMRHLNYGNIGAGYISFENYKLFIDKNKEYIKNIEISNSGEPFLNPDILKILEYSYKNNIELTCKNGTNFNFENDDLIKALVDYQFSLIYVAIDGASQETYSKYRRKGNFNLVIDNIRKLNLYKQEKNSEYPKLVWQYIVRDSTENPEEIKKAIELANELNMQMYFKLTWEKFYKPTPEWIPEIKALTGMEYLTRAEVPPTHEHWQFHKCLTLCNYKKIVVNWDGRWLGCCANKNPSDLNLFKISLPELFNSDLYKRTLEYLLDNRTDNIDDIFCNKCPTLARVNRLELGPILKTKL